MIGEFYQELLWGEVSQGLVRTDVIVDVLPPEKGMIERDEFQITVV